LEDGPVGGTPIRFGDDIVGHAVEAPLPKEGGWHLGRSSDISLAQTAYQLCERERVWLPTMNECDSVTIPITSIGKIGQVGPYHSDISGNTASGSVRGPFSIAMVEAGTTPTYPVLWSHDAERERNMEFVGESEGMVRRGSNRAEELAIRQKVATIWATASHCHFNRDFRFNSQSTAMQFTPRLTLGGRAWLSIHLENVEYEKALTAWGNTSLGLLLYWYYANKQQSGRGSIGKSMLQQLTVLDVRLPSLMS
jgi:hypothetical protein